jgi:hypothetical protein
MIIINCNWGDTRWQQYTFTHKQYTEYRGRNTHNNYKEERNNYKEKNNNYKEQKFGSKLGSAGRAFALQLRKRVILIVIIINCNWGDTRWQQYTFTHKQYTEYRGRNTHNNYKGKKKQVQGKNWEVHWEVRAVHLPYN